MQLNEKNIFLLDGIGAILSACFTGLILVRFSLFIGISYSNLQKLSLLSVAFALYSLSCYFLIKKTKPWMLLAIIWANLFYCFLSGAIILLWERITWRGQAVLAAEILVVLIVIILEIRVYRNIRSAP